MGKITLISSLGENSQQMGLNGYGDGYGYGDGSGYGDGDGDGSGYG